MIVEWRMVLEDKNSIITYHNNSLVSNALPVSY